MKKSRKREREGRYSLSRLSGVSCSHISFSMVTVCLRSPEVREREKGERERKKASDPPSC